MGTTQLLLGKISSVVTSLIIFSTFCCCLFVLNQTMRKYLLQKHRTQLYKLKPLRSLFYLLYIPGVVYFSCLFHWLLQQFSCPFPQYFQQPLYLGHLIYPDLVEKYLQPVLNKPISLYWDKILPLFSKLINNGCLWKKIIMRRMSKWPQNLGGIWTVFSQG